MDINESNKLIAKFMGIQFNVQGDKCNHPMVLAPWPPIECLKYHSSWDWLMPVCYKIKTEFLPDVKDCDEINNKIMALWERIAVSVACINIDLVYESVLAHINYINTVRNTQD